ncbi:MAG: fibronectin type III domain-containing protein, partial [Croceimicrobium sp.]
GTMVSGTSTNPHSLTGLTANTTYDYYVRADCGGSTSGYTGPFTFSTPCVAFTAPYTESFDAASLPTCWAQSSTSGGPWTFTSPGFSWNTSGCAASPSDNTGNSGNYAAMDHSSTDVGVIMEMNDVDVSALTTAYLEFYFWMCGSGYSPLNILHVEAYDGTTWNNVTTIQQGTSGWESFGFDISSHIYGANLVKLRFRTESGGSGSDFYGDIAIDDVSIMEAPSCLSPSSLSATNITTSAADLGWVENGTATAWILEYGTSGFSQGAGTTVLAGSNPYNLAGLSSDTEYDYYVRAFCAVGDSSSWIGPFTFRTLCNPFTAPYSQNFDGETAPAVNSCWTVINTATSARLQTDATPIGTTANSAPNSVEFYNGSGTTPSQQILVSPMFSDLDNTKRIKFFLYDFSNTSDMIIGTMSDPNNAATFSPFDTITEADMDDDVWEEFTVSFASYTGSDKYIAFAHGMNTTFDYIHLDDFQYLDIPSCPEPTFLTSANITNAGVDFGWTESGSATSWQVSYGTTGTTAMAGTKMVVATNPFSISGLTGNTGYDLFVRSICAVGDTSIWVGPISISTLCDPVLAPWSENFDNGGAIPACWNQGSANVENWRFSSGSGAQYGPTSDNTSGSGYYAWIDDSSPHNTSTSLESPSIDLSGLAFPMLRFQLWSENHGNTTTFELNVDINSGSGWVLDSTFDIENTGWELQSLDLSAYTGQTIQIRFRGDEVGTGFQKDIAIDDVEVIETPNCPDPSGLSASNVSQSEADIDWTENGTATAWDIEYGAKGFSPTGTPSNAGITKPYTITGLSGAMAYDVYVRAACGGTDGNSSWVGPMEFTTLPDTAEGITCGTGVASVLFSEDFENNSAGWTGSINSGNGSWEIPDGATSSGTGANAGFGGGNYMNYEASSSVNNNG